MPECIVEIYRAPTNPPTGERTITVNVVDRTIKLFTSVPGVGCWFTRFAAPEPGDLPQEARELLTKGQLPAIERYFPLQARNVLNETHDNDALGQTGTTLTNQEEHATELMHLPKTEAEAILHYFFRAPALHDATRDALVAGRIEADLLYGTVEKNWPDRYKLPNAECSIFGFATRPGWLLERFRDQY